MWCKVRIKNQESQTPEAIFGAKKLQFSLIGVFYSYLSQSTPIIGEQNEQFIERKIRVKIAHYGLYP